MSAIYQSAWALVTLLSCAVLVPVVATIWLTEPARLLGLTRITGTTLDLALLLLFLHVAMSIQTGILQVAVPGNQGESVLGGARQRDSPPRVVGGTAVVLLAARWSTWRSRSWR